MCEEIYVMKCLCVVEGIVIYVGKKMEVVLLDWFIVNVVVNNVC